jgi:hypothetical protein
MLLLAGGILSVSTLAQTAAPSPSAAPVIPAQSAPAKDSSTKPEKVLTPAEAQKLLADIPQILEFSSKDTGLAIHSKVKGRVTSRDAVEKYLLEKMKDDKETQRMERSELVMKKFGLLDTSFQLQPFLVSLLREQIAGYYDDKAKTMNLLDWVDPDDQQPVMAHELTHALQDQRVGLEKWEKAANDDSKPSKNFKEDTERVAKDEVGTARDAVVEGQAMIPLIDLGLKDVGQSVRTAPQVVPLMTAQMAETDVSTSPVLARAPLMIQESMLFSYREGLTFEAAILAKDGMERAFAGTLDQPPNTSAEILHPEQYLSNKKQPLIKIPDVHPLLDANYSPYDIGVVGEFDVKTLADLFVGEAESAEITPQWRGGTYYAGQRRSDEKTPRKDSTASIALVYYSEWASPEAARRFAEIYQKQFPRKYGHLKLVAASQEKSDQLGDHETAYNTDEGYAVVSVAGNGVFISEGFTQDEAHKLQAMFLAGRTEGALQASAPSLTPDNDLSASLRTFLAHAGVMRCALPHHPVGLRSSFVY